MMITGRFKKRVADEKLPPIIGPLVHAVENRNGKPEEQLRGKFMRCGKF